MTWTDIPGWLEPAEGEALQELARDKIVLEIGSFKGRSTVCMAMVAKQVVSVDHHRGDERIGPQWSLPDFACNLAKFEVLDKVSILVQKSNDLPFGSFIFDFAFIDGAHDYDSVWNDFYSATQHITQDAIVAFHDCGLPGPAKLIEFMEKGEWNKLGHVRNLAWFSR